MNSWWDQLVSSYKAQPTKVIALAGMSVFGLLLWGRLLLTDPPRVATADPEPTVNQAETRSAEDARPSAESTIKPELVVPVSHNAPRNLFQARDVASTGPSASTGEESQTDSDDSPSRTMIRERAQQLSLQAVVLGSEPRAVINGTTVRPGQAIDGFKLLRVGRRHADLEMHGTTVRIGLP
ncbi:hypothetical protein [Mucisphaera calidilacus]|uniref:Uncharacterized protein n=1 Tax=Mucisphaera calidilacus TaxID=2527982 RepID=A0A518BT99_9BACT|nr:hypothetical protein [Mucisphaera calidilacus]QDU70201.1 hypothetical protein Pan265_00230 [Mucisphaera calidilacus]